MDAELALLPDQISTLQTQHTELALSYDQATSESRALSANLEVDQIKDEAPNTVHLRPTANLMLVGGVLGILILCLGWFVQITRRTE